MSATPVEIEDFLHQLAVDEILVTAARDRGFGPTEEQRLAIADAIHTQLARIATRYRISARLATNPEFNRGSAALQFIATVIAAGEPVPWLTEFRPVLEHRLPSRVDAGGSETAANLAGDIRASARTDIVPEDGREDPPASSEPSSETLDAPESGEALSS